MKILPLLIFYLWFLFISSMKGRKKLIILDDKIIYTKVFNAYEGYKNQNIL